MVIFVLSSVMITARAKGQLHCRKRCLAIGVVVIISPLAAIVTGAAKKHLFIILFIVFRMFALKGRNS